MRCNRLLLLANTLRAEVWKLEPDRSAVADCRVCQCSAALVLATLKLEKLAVLVRDILGFYDLCHVVLEEIDRRESHSLAPRYRERLGVVNGPSGA